jgi:superfamily II DNA or RNA helicase
MYVPHGLDKSTTMKINKAIDAYLDSIGAPKEYNNYGKLQHNRWKFFNKDKNALHTYWVHYTVLGDILEVLKSKGFDIEYEDPSQTGFDQPPEVKQLEVLGIEDGNWGKKIGFQVFPNDKSWAVWNAAKEAGLTPKSLSFADNPKRLLIAMNNNAYKDILGILANNDIDTSELEKFVQDNNLFQAYAQPEDSELAATIANMSEEHFDAYYNRIKEVYDRITSGKAPQEDIDGLKKSANKLPQVEKILEKHPDPQKQANAKKMIKALYAVLEMLGKPKEIEKELGLQKTGLGIEDAGGNQIKVKIPYQQIDDQQKAFLKQLVTYIFPNYTWLGKPELAYQVEGNYKQYVLFGQLLDKYDYPVDQFRKILKAKIDRGDIEVGHYEGKIDPNFVGQIDKNLPNSKFDLYDAQKEGIGFLYSRDHAILGDETGLGKTVQLIAAAALKMQETNKPTLIVTLKATQSQWVREIIEVMGEQETSEISTDPLNPKKWTVLYYENFSQGKQVPYYILKLKETDFGIAIFDELHKVKHTSAKRSKNIAYVIDPDEKGQGGIPTRWGASATVSANKPFDVKNQLKVIGHPLGDVKKGKFKKDFAGMVSGGWGGAYIEGDIDSQIAAAENLNKWLNLTGVYVRRGKDEVKDMPNLEVKSDEVSVDSSLFHKRWSERLKTYKNPDLPVSQLIAARDILATLKTDETTQRAAEIVEKNQDNSANNYAASKIVVFTNFIESAEVLKSKLSTMLKSINPNYYLLTYLKDTKKKERESVKSTFTEDPNAKILLMSMKMGGTGIDFPNAAQHMVINDFDWTPESAEQSEGRIYRINTTHPVYITYVVANGLDAELYEKVQYKRKIATKIQLWRKELQELGDSAKAAEKLQDIVDAQKEMVRINDEITKIAQEMIPKDKKKDESFKAYISGTESLKEEIFGNVW